MCLILSLAGAISLAPLKAATAKSLVVYKASSWDFWYLHYIHDSTSDKSFLSGYSLLGLSTQVKSPIVLYFGVNSGRDNNFYDQAQSVFADLYLDITSDSNKYTFGFNPGQFSLSTQQRQNGELSDFRFNFNEDYSKDSIDGYHKRLPFIIDGSYLQYHHSFSLGYQKTLWDGLTTVSINYIPNLDFNLATAKSSSLEAFSHLGAFDAGIKYYNEYKDIGYGFNGVGRAYLRGGRKLKGADIYISPVLDYLGLSVGLNFLYGSIHNGDNISKTTYQLNELRVEYKVFSFGTSFVYGYNDVSYRVDNQDEHFYNSHAVINLAYIIDKNFSIKASVFRENQGSGVNNGIALGFNIGA